MTRLANRTASVTVEMAILLPVFLLLVFGIFEFGRVWLTVNAMTYAGREAARLAVVTVNLGADDSTVIAQATSLLTAAGVSGAAVTNTAPSGTPPQVTVTISLNYSWLSHVGPLFGFGFTGTIPLNNSTTMRYEIG